MFAASIDEIVYVCRAFKFTRVASAAASASFLSVDSRCLTEKMYPRLRTRPQNTGIHDECEVRYRKLVGRYRVFAARVC